MTNPVDESTPFPETPVSSSERVAHNFEDNINEQSLKKYTFKFLDPNEIPIEKSSTEPLPKYDYRFLNPDDIQTAENLGYNLLGMISHKKSLITHLMFFHKKFNQHSILVYIWNKIANFEPKLN